MQQATPSTKRTSVTEWKTTLLSLVDTTTSLIPAVRYGTPETRQLPQLHTLRQPSPPEATTVSPIYFLTSEELNHQEELNNLYQVTGSSSIAKELQDECEQDGRVLYPIQIESDSLEAVGRLDTMAAGLRNFLNERLNLQQDECTWWYSGNRSIHVHTPLFVTNEERQRLKSTAKAYNASEGTDVQIDVSNFNQKSQFRLPHVKHSDTGALKVQIDPTWSHKRIFQESTQSTSNRPLTYRDVLNQAFPSPQLSPSVYAARSGDTGDEAFDSANHPDDGYINRDSRAGIIEAEAPHATGGQLWFSYNAKEFSPYALTGGENGRSMTIVQVKGSAFCRPEFSEDARLPCYIIAAVGGNRKFSKQQEHAPLLLSKQDYQKIADEVAIGDHLIVIGGRSRSSRIYNIERYLAFGVGNILNEDGFKDALEVMEQIGYDVGASAGTGASSTGTSTAENPTTSEAAKKRIVAEEEGVEKLSHNDLTQVANHLLQTKGWKSTCEWFRSQFGAEFDEEATHKQLRSIVRRYDDLSHIDVPSPS